jgi:outer membrane scaffolding protein for murein synthesis (MipA/OmpV family)
MSMTNGDLFRGLRLALLAGSILGSTAVRPQSLPPASMEPAPVPAASARPARFTQLPRWEAGVSAIGLYAPDYRGSDQMSAFGLPLPYLIYRGEWLRADREGVRAQLIESDRIQFNFSAGLGLPVDSDSNEARRGMPEVDWVVELGPAMNLNLARWDAGKGELDLRLPVRAAFAVDDGFDYVGAVFAPNLRLTLRNVAWAGGAQLRVSTGPLFATDDYHRFYYGVEPQFATATRPAYRPDGGYSGWDLSASAVKFAGDWRLFGFAGADFIVGAEFEDSPLIRKRSTWSVGGGVAYVFARSNERVRALE